MTAQHTPPAALPPERIAKATGTLAISPGAHPAQIAAERDRLRKVVAAEGRPELARVINEASATLLGARRRPKMGPVRPILVVIGTVLCAMIASICWDVIHRQGPEQFAGFQGSFVEWMLILGPVVAPIMLALRAVSFPHLRVLLNIGFWACVLFGPLTLLIVTPIASTVAVDVLPLLGACFALLGVWIATSSVTADAEMRA